MTKQQFPTPPLYRLTDNDGVTFEGTSAWEILDMLRFKQFDPVDDVAQLKKVLAVRAEAWCGRLVDPSLPDVEFLQALVRCGLFSEFAVPMAA